MRTEAGRKQAVDDLDDDMKRPGLLAGRHMLFVAPDDYPAYRVDLVELFSRHLVERGLHIDWSLYRANEGEAGIEVRGQERYFLPDRKPGGLLRKIRNRLSTGAVRWRLVWRAARGDYDLVQVRDYVYWGIPFLIAARIARKPFVFWMSFPVLETRWLAALRPYRPIGWAGRIANLLHAAAGKLVFYRFLRLADHLVVQSKRMSEVLQDRGIPRRLMTPVEMGVTTERYNPDATPACTDERLRGRRVIGYMSSQFFGVPFHAMLGALARVREAGHDAVLLCVGPVADHEREVLGESLRRLGLPRESVVDTGHLPLPRALSYIKAADVCVSPIELIPQQEVATPTKLVEYLAMGRPVVASLLYDHCEVIGGSGAGLVVELTPAAFGEALSRVLDDRDWAEEMGARGPGWVKANRDYSRLADRVERLFASLLHTRAQPKDQRTLQHAAE